MRKQFKAFTLIELLIVIAIIGILAGILFVSIGQSPLEAARDTKRVADLQNLHKALQIYYTTNTAVKFSYPLALTDLVPNYIAGVPLDPKNGQAGCNITYGGNANYKYTYTAQTAAAGVCTTAAGTCTNYVLKACLEQLSHDALKGDCDTGGVPACDLDRIFDIHS